MSGGGGAGKGAAGASGPALTGVRKMVQSLKEIVNRPEAEIYAALRECDMSPDEAVTRLLSQDTFQEVKSKRDKKKEVKETPELRSRAANNSANRGTRGGADRSGRNSSVQSSSSDNVASRSSILGPGVPATNSTQKQMVPGSSGNKNVVPDGPSVSLQPSSGFQHSWSGIPGQMSMADIVKMGRPQGKPSGKPIVTMDGTYAGQNTSLSCTVSQDSKLSARAALLEELDQGFPSLQDTTQVIDPSYVAADNQQTYENDWTAQDETPLGNQLTLPKTSGDPSLYSASLGSTLVADAVSLHEKSHLDENNSVATRLPTTSEGHLEHPEDNSEFHDGLLQNPSTYQSQVHDEVEDPNVDVSSAAANFQHLSLHNGEIVATKSAEDNPAVIIPDHLQVTNADCAHLSFGSFGSGAFSGFLPPNAVQSNVEELAVADESTSVNQVDVSNQDYYDNGALNSSANENVGTRNVDMENLDVPSVSQSDVLRPSALDASGLQYSLPSVSAHAYSDTIRPSAMEGPEGNMQAHDMSHLSTLLHGNSLQNSLLGSNVPPLRDFDFSLSPLLSAQSMVTKYNSAVPSTTSGPDISMQEAMKPGVFSNTPSAQNLPSMNIPTGPPLPQQLPVHPYSQPTLPLGPFANLIGYPYLPQSYTYLPSAAFQQAYSSNGPFHQSAAAVPGTGMKYSMPQYKSSLSATSLQQPSSVVSGYGGGFGSSSNMPGNFNLNQSTASATSTLGFDEALSMRYKDASQYMALQQSDNSAMWLHGAGSRAVSTLPAGNFYGYQGQSQQGGFRQGQQPSQYGGPGYPNFYHSQTGLTQEHPQNPTEASLNGSQTAPSQPSHHLWQHSY